MRGFLGLSVLPLLVSASPILVDTIHNEAAPILSSVNAKDIPNSYMVVFKKHLTHDDATAHHTWVQDVHLATQSIKTELRKRDHSSFQDTVFEGLRHTYHIPGGLLGYSGHFDDEVIEQVRRHPDVS
jgi:cerevisin